MAKGINTQVVKANQNASEVSYNNTISWLTATNVNSAIDEVHSKAIQKIASSTDNAIVRWDGTTWRFVQDSSVFITDTWSVGIGTSSPTWKLHIVDGWTSLDATLKLNNRFTFLWDGVMQWWSAAAQWYLSWNTWVAIMGGLTLNDLALYANGSEKVRVLQNGNVWIGTASPFAVLEIGTTSSINNYIRVIGSATNDTYLVFSGQRKFPKFELVDTFTGGSTFNFWNLGNTMRFGTNTGTVWNSAWYTKSGDAADVIFNGKVGIGTSWPVHKLEVNWVISSTGSSDLWASVGTNFRIAWGFGSPDIGRIFVGDGTGWKFHISKRSSSITTDLVTFSDRGSVGIGVTTPTAYLHISAWTASANTAPIKLTAWVKLTTPEDGAIEYDGTNLYFTIWTTRKTFTLV